MKIISWNVNGIRAVLRKGFLDWFRAADADIICLQEIKAGLDKIPADLFNLSGWHSYFNPAQKPGYAGTAVFCKEKPLETGEEMGLKKFDDEGRVLFLKFKDFTLFNFYIPFGGRDKESLAYKLKAYDCLLDYLQKTNEATPPPKWTRSDLVLLAGDFNVAHKEIDLARPKENEGNIMFTKEEREKIDKLIELGFVDTFRYFYPNKTGAYTWWSHFSNARARNLGWRIDYLFAGKALAPRLKNAYIWPQVMGSDHCPAGVDIKI